MLICLMQINAVNAQISSGKIVYERKSNLYKRLKHWDDIKDQIPEADKIKTDFFELYFNDTISAFTPIESELKDKYEWATTQNATYQNFNTKNKLTYKKIWGEPFLLADSLIKRVWKVTESKRNIAGYECRKAIWQANDSVRIYAWYADDIICGVGPESFYGLPGAILGLANEDGGIVYFAKSIDVVKPTAIQLMPPKTKLKPYATNAFKAKLQKDYSKEKWWPAMLKNHFGGVN